MRKYKSKKYSMIKYKGLEENVSSTFAFEVIISVVKLTPEGYTFIGR